MAKKKRSPSKSKKLKKPVKKSTKKPVKKSTKKPIKKSTKKLVKKASKKPAKRKPVKIKKPGFVIPAGAVRGGGSTPIYSPTIMQDNINLALLAAKRRLTSPEATEFLGIKTPLDVSVKTHTNLSGSVDGQLTVRAIPRGLRLHDLLLDMEAMFPSVPESFVSVGLRYRGKEGIKSADYRHKGMYVAHANYQRTARAIKIRENFLTARNIVNSLEEHNRNKPQQVVVNYHWNPEGRRPIRKKAPKKPRRRR
jgi:hypothetical protein